MSRNAKLDKRVMSMYGVISCWQVDIKKICEVLMTFFTLNEEILHYYFIFHDDEDTNLHYHYCIRLNRAVRCSTMLNKLETYFKAHINGFDRNQIGVEPLTDLNAMLRYFIHFEYDDKKQYQPYDIKSDETYQMILSYINTDNYELTTERLIAYIVNASTIDDLMFRMGLRVYHKYRYEIKELWDNKSVLMIRYKHLISHSNDLPF